MLVQCVRVVQLNYVKVQCMAYCKVGVLGLGEIGVRLILLSKDFLFYLLNIYSV